MLSPRLVGDGILWGQYLLRVPDLAVRRLLFLGGSRAGLSFSGKALSFPRMLRLAAWRSRYAEALLFGYVPVGPRIIVAIVKSPVLENVFPRRWGESVFASPHAIHQASIRRPNGWKVFSHPL